MHQTFHGEARTYRGWSLSDGRVIMAIIHVLVEELICLVVMGHIPVLKCLLSGVRGHLWLRPMMLGLKCRGSSGTWLQRLYSVLENPQE
jgi:hypothetical protein